MANEFKELQSEELLKNLSEKREALRAFRFGTSGGRARNVREGRMLRRDIARILTELRARELHAVAVNRKSA